MVDQKYLRASDGTGAAVLAHVSVNRLAGATTLQVDNVDNWPPFFIATSGKLDPNGYITEATKREFRGHLQSGQIIIDGFEPGFTDGGNTTDQVVIIKQTVSWADGVVGRLVPAGVVSPFAGTTAPLDWLLCDGASLLRADYPELFVVIGSTYGAVDGAHFNLPDLRSREVIGAGQSTYVDTQPAASYNTSDVITVKDNDTLHTGQAVVLTTDGAAPGGLTAGTTYYVIRNSATAIRLATSRANAVAGTAINITSTGTGNHTLTLTLTNRALGRVGGEERHSITVDESPSHLHSVSQVAFVDRRASSTVAGSSNAEGVVNNQASKNTSSTGGSEDHNLMNPYLALNYIIKV